MPDEMTCFACTKEPVQQCPRCGRPYCEDHGAELCDICLSPASGVPSFTLYRGSLLALLIGTAIAVWLLVQPSSGESNGPRPIILTPATVARNQTPGPQQTAAPNQTPAPNLTPGAQTPPPATTGTAPARTPSPPAATGTAGAATTPATGSTYTVRTGDTLSTICAAQRPQLGSSDCVAQLRSLNNITGDTIAIGQQLKLP